MNDNEIIEKIARDICDLGGQCLRCNASTSFECTAKKYAKRIYEMGYSKPEDRTAVKGRN